MLKKLKGLSAMSRMEPDIVGQIIDGLFPQHPPPMVALPIVEENGISLLGTKEVDAAVNRLRGSIGRLQARMRFQIQSGASYTQLTLHCLLIHSMRQLLGDCSLCDGKKSGKR